jgi:hypothetical protein
MSILLMNNPFEGLKARKQDRNCCNNITPLLPADEQNMNTK